MKIKKSEYEKKLDDKYWEGVKVGMKFTLRDPLLAAKYVDSIPTLRIAVEHAKHMNDVAKSISNEISRLFKFENKKIKERDYETDSGKKTDREDN